MEMIPETSRQSLLPGFLYSPSSSMSMSPSKNLGLTEIIPSRSPNPSQSLGGGGAVVAGAPNEKRKIAMYSPMYYAACAAGGTLCCGLTHMAVTPLDLVKCNMQVILPFFLFHSLCRSC